MASGRERSSVDGSSSKFVLSIDHTMMLLPEEQLLLMKSTEEVVVGTHTVYDPLPRTQAGPFAQAAPYA